MGRRAKKAPVQTKKRVVLAKRFKCPFCANDESVECQMKHREGTGSLSCRICDASFQMPIHHLHEPIDVFSEWLDACEAAEKRQTGGGGAQGGDGGEDLLGAGLGGASSGSGRDGGDVGGGRDESSRKQAYASLGLGDSDDDSE